MAANVQTRVLLVIQIFIFLLCNEVATHKKVNYQIVNSNDLRLSSENYQIVNVLPHVRSRRDTPPDSGGANAPGSLPDSNISQNSLTGSTGVGGVTSTATVITTASDSNVTSNTSTVAVTQSTTIKTSTIASTESTTTASDPFAEADVIHDQHIYYTSEVMKNKVDSYWQELSSAPRHETLSSGHRVAAVIPLKFPFHFYGHAITNVTVATGGFIYMSPFLHQWLTATQYIAPLMANFDPSMNKDSGIYYKNDEDKFTVEWKNVMLKDQNSSGPFNFQAILHKDDNIHFVYKSVPISVRSISTEEHPVKIGLSDAYYNDTYLPEYKIKRRTIYEYHKVVVRVDAITSGTVVVLKPLPTCNRLLNCQECVKHENVKFDCRWCNSIGRCSDGLDWYRQHWDKEGCQQSSGATPFECSLPSSPTMPMSSSVGHDISTSTDNIIMGSTENNGGTTANISDSLGQSRISIDCGLLCSSLPVRPVTDSQSPEYSSNCNNTKDVAGCLSLPPPLKNITDPLKVFAPMIDPCQNGKCNQKNDFPVAVIVVIVFIICGLLGAIGGWVYYAYTHPTSKSGIWLMEHRPSLIKANIKFWKSSTDAGTKYKVESEA